MTANPGRPTETLSQACARHEAYLRGRLRGLGVPEAGLDDAVQDVFEVLVRRIGAYDSRFSLRQWMAGVARKIARRHRERGLRAPEGLDEAQTASPALDPEGWAARQEALADLQAFLGELDRDRWAVFVLAEIEGLRGTEIAAELGVNLSTVYARLRVAKDSFERTMTRRRRAERRSWLLLPLFGEPSGRTSAAFTTPLALLGLLTTSGGTALAIRGCAQTNDGSATEEAVVNVGRRESAETPVGTFGVQAREVDPADGGLQALRETASLETEGWIAGPSQSSSGGGWTTTSQLRYRLLDDEAIFEVELLGDDAVASDNGIGWVELEGFARVEGPGSWSQALAPAERRVITLRLRAVRDGVVRAEVHHGRRIGESYGASGVWLVREQGRLRRCRDRECDRTAESIEESLIGETVAIDLHNQCTTAIEVAMLPCELLVPPPDAPRVRLASGERRAVTVDAALCFGRVREDGRLGSSAGGSDGFVITFSGEGCDWVASHSKHLPPELVPGPTGR
ncbi:sigma-70 family RNA polymerase sigma factor [Nannocystis sp. SCPEA4]|uniref:RNA polymerase sigma factor n=1 Tax=Nannocystis sp. SCPEA4 TaxID=2996787 RepID=UPI00226E0392|nr:sigma-70 family RNA polymerase sigma factor [Nannocystis sp. SCPEA4]MCY1059250.1 sigma-70 family RNA polymerase sigma factor [Nannocystis sp. SCPEA4]